MDTLRPVQYLGVSCVGCGNRIALQFILPKYVLSAPDVACSEECIRRYEASTQAWLERKEVWH